MSEAQSTLNHIKSCKAQIHAVLENYTGFMQTGFMISVADHLHAEKCLDEVIDDLFAGYIVEADEEIEVENSQAVRAEHKELHSF